MIGVLLMAAGKSRRFKQETGQHKLRYSLQHDSHHESLSLLKQSYQQLCSAFSPAQIVIITNHEEPEISQIAQNLQSIVIQIYTDGLGTSIARGLTHIEQRYPEMWQHWQGILIAHADMPFVQQTTLIQLEEYLLNPESSHATVRPRYHNRAGHPVGFRRDCFSELEQLTGDNGGKSILETFPPQYINTNDIGTIWDIDEVQDLTQSPNNIHQLR